MEVSDIKTYVRESIFKNYQQKQRKYEKLK